MLMTFPGPAQRAARAVSVLVVLVVLVVAPCALAAQGRVVRFEADSARAPGDGTTSGRRAPGAEVSSLPVDSLEGALLLQPGITGSAGGLSFRGGAPGEYSTYLDGIDITPGSRRVRLTPATNMLGAATAVTGPLPGMLGNSSSGAMLLETRRPGPGRSASLAFETDRFLGPTLGLNRLEGSLGGETRSARVFLAGSVTGQKSAEFGADARDLPVFVAAGEDTTLAIPGTPGSSASDTTFFVLPAFAVSRGDCDRFGASENAEIADNYGLECRGDRTPASAHSGYRLLAGADYEIGRASRLSIITTRARESARLFSYRDLYNRANLFAAEDEARVYGISLAGPLGARNGGGSYRIGVSRQRDQRVVGPLTAESEAKTSDPAGGFMLGGLDFRWDLESFPVDSGLIANYRANEPGTRRSPYDLENTDQYRLADEFRDDPYALGGFPERGGPIGTIALFREDRTVAFGHASWMVSRNALFTLGGEYVKYTVTNYEHGLVSQAFSDVYTAKPVRGAVYAEDRLSYGPVRFVGGVRYDFFSSRALRPMALDTVASNATFGEYQPFPRISSYSDADGTYTLDGSALPLVDFREDERHAAWSPRFRASYDAGASTVLRAGYSRHARMPDLGDLLAGLNTDLAITNTDFAFGADIGFERSWVGELGLRQQLGASTSLDLAGYRRTTSDAPRIRLVSLRDPTRDNQVDLRQLAAVGNESALSLEALLEHRAGPVNATLAYTFQRVRSGEFPAAWERPHSVAAMLGYTAPESRRGAMRGAGAWLAFRMSSGAPYTSCSVDSGELSDEQCLSFGFPPNTARLPAFRQLDLRFTKQLGARPGSVLLYVDARNLLNMRNTLRVFSGTGTTENEPARQEVVNNAIIGIRDEAAENGVLQGDQSADLRFSGDGAGGCAGWVTVQGDGGAPNCVALVRAEQRFGNGDGIYSAEEQRTVAEAHFDVMAGSFYGAPRRVRLGIELTF
jgi:hypothetical protein